MRRKSVPCLVVLLAIGVCGCGSSVRSRATTPSTPGVQLGANVGRLFNGLPYSRAQIAAELAVLRSTGAALARSDAPWESAEPSRPLGGHHRYRWWFDDLVAGSLAASGLRWLPIVDYSPTWTQSRPGVDHSPPRSDADFAAYAAALARRYGPHGSFWNAHPQLRALPVQAYEIWNEPDNARFWEPRFDAAAYLRLYLAARAAIRAEQPAARVVVGGLTRPETSLPAMLSADPGARRLVDAVAIHPYAPTPAGVLSRVVAARRTLASLGLGATPLYVTEFGWATRPAAAADHASAAFRRSYIESTIPALAQAGCGVAAILLYAWVTPEVANTESGDWFGIEPPPGELGTRGGAGSGAGVAAFTEALARARVRAGADVRARAGRACG